MPGSKQPNVFGLQSHEGVTEQAAWQDDNVAYWPNPVPGSKQPSVFGLQSQDAEDPLVISIESQ